SPLQVGVRWLGTWWDRKPRFRRHVQDRCPRAVKVANHLRYLDSTKNGPPAYALRKVVTTVVIPTITYAAECWYAGRTRPTRQGTTTSTRIGWHIEMVQRAITSAARAILSVWMTTPNRTLCRDAGIPLAEVALEDIRLRFAFRFKLSTAPIPL
ncbi:hypothetical protein QBC38DRAFT_373909, partial [Podospora fimiseda]